MTERAFVVYIGRLLGVSVRLLVLALLVSCTPDASVDPTAEPIGAYDPLDWVDPIVGTGGLGAQVAAVNPARLHR